MLAVESGASADGDRVHGGAADTFEDETGHLATQAEVDRAIERAVERLERAILAVETRMTRLLLTFAIGVIGINLAAIATAVGIILGFN